MMTAEHRAQNPSGPVAAFISRRFLYCGLGLALLTLSAYWPSFSADFINYDDPLYVYENQHVLSGLTIENFNWAFTTFNASNWHPLTWLSLQADASFFGVNPVGYHMMNVVIHLMNVLLLFSLLLQLTGEWGPSWIAAGLFAVHPLHVESVAWVTERKDVLSSLFGLGALLCYVIYARKPTAVWYAAVSTLMALSLMAKPMWVTLPALLLLLDYWQWQRLRGATAESSSPESIPQQQSPYGPYLIEARFRSWVWVIVEKLPLVAMTMISCMITLSAQQKALKTLAYVALPTRLTNAIVATVIYLKMTIWPTRLAPFYPYPSSGRTYLLIAVCSLLLMGITAGLVWQRRRQPALIVGWLWFLGTLTPVIGIVQVGGQAYADRYTYVPHVGLLITLIWTADACFQWIRIPRTLKQVAGVVVIIAGVCLTRVQVGYWQNSEILWRHTVTVTRDNTVALNNLGTAIARHGKLRDAVSYFEQAVKLQPGDATGQFNLGNSLKDLGQPDLAAFHLRACLTADPGYPGVQNALGVALAMAGRIDDAVIYLTEATQQNPQDAGAWYNLGTTLAGQGKFTAAVPALVTAVKLRPSQSSTHIMLAWAQYETGDLASAREHYRESLRIDPNWVAKTNQYAWTLATTQERSARNGKRALQLASRICQATEFRQADYLNTLAAAFAETAQFSEALTTIDKALTLLTALNAPSEQLAAFNARRELYLRHEPCHESKLYR